MNPEKTMSPQSWETSKYEIDEDMYNKIRKIFRENGINEQENIPQSYMQHYIILQNSVGVESRLHPDIPEWHDDIFIIGSDIFEEILHLVSEEGKLLAKGNSR
jgi:hypothetical protein